MPLKYNKEIFSSERSVGLLIFTVTEHTTEVSDSDGQHCGR